MSRRVKTLFTLSIVMNVLLLSVMSGHFVHKYRDEHWPNNLSEDGRSIVRSVMRDKLKEFVPLRMNISKKRRELYQVLAADEFDSLAYDVLVQDIASLKSAFEQHKAGAMKDVVLGFSDEERQQFAREMSEKLAGREKRWSDRRSGPHGHK